MKNRLFVYSFILIAFFTFTHCTKTVATTSTDIDQLYAVQNNKNYKDSLAKVLYPRVAMLLKQSNNYDHRKAMDSTLQILRWTSDSINFKALSKKTVKYAIDAGDKSTLANTYNNIGMYYHDSSQLDSTFYYYIKTENIYKELNDSVKIGETKFYQARLLFEMGLHMESESKVSQSLLMLHNYPNNPVNFEANQLMGLCLMERKNFKEAEVYLRTAILLILKSTKKNKVLDDRRRNMALGNAYGNLSEVCYEQEKFEEAKKYAIEGQKYTDNTSPIMLISFLKNSLAQANYRLTRNEKYIEEVIDSFKADSILHNYFRMHYSAMDLAQLYIIDNKPTIANLWAKKAYDNATKNNVIPQQVEALEFLLSNDDYYMKDQVKHLIKLRQVLTNQDNQTRNTFARIAYETEIIEQENIKLKDLIYIITISGFSLVLLLTIGIFRYKLKSQRKELLLVTAQRKANENINELIIERSLIALDTRKKERNRIAKDLHDGVVNTIFTIRFNLQLLDTNDNSTKELLIQELHKLENNTRDISHDLMDNAFFNESKFLHVIEDFTSMQINAWRTIFSVKSDKMISFDRINSNTKVNIFYILRESLQNVNKHSKASRCTIRFKEGSNGMRIIIEDNGIGFKSNTEKGMGISNIRERADQIGATLSIESKQNKGTKITIVIPFNNL